MGYKCHTCTSGQNLIRWVRSEIRLHRWRGSFRIFEPNGHNTWHTGESQCMGTLINLQGAAMSGIVSKRFTSENILDGTLRTSLLLHICSCLYSFTNKLYVSLIWKVYCILHFMIRLNGQRNSSLKFQDLAPLIRVSRTENSRNDEVFISHQYYEAYLTWNSYLTIRFAHQENGGIPQSSACSISFSSCGVLFGACLGQFGNVYDTERCRVKKISITMRRISNKTRCALGA